MAFHLNEFVVAALVERLEAELPAAVAELNAEAGAPVVLEPPANVLDSVPSEDELLSFPTIAVEDGPVRFDDDIGSSVTGRMELVVAVFLAHADRPTLARQLRRYARAVVTVALRDRSLGEAYGVRLRETVPGPTLGAREPDDTRSWWSFVAVVLEADTDDG